MEGLTDYRVLPSQWDNALALANYRAPINMLPNELLVTVVHCVRDVDPEGWMNVLLVCRLWFHIASETPTLWTRALVQDRFDFLRTCLARSKDLEFTLLVTKAHTIGGAGEVIALHTHRLREICIPDWRWRPGGNLSFLYANRHPALRKLKVVSFYGSELPTEPIVWIHPRNIPNLEVLSLAGCTMCFVPGEFPRVMHKLRKLKLTENLGVCPSLPVDYFAYHLEHMPNLQELVVRAPRCLRRKDREPERVVLPRLRTVVLSTDDFSIFETLSFLEIPPQADVRLECQGKRWPGPTEDGTLTQGLRAILPLDQGTLPILNMVTKVDATVMRHERVFFARRPDIPGSARRPVSRSDSDGDSATKVGTILLNDASAACEGPTPPTSSAELAAHLMHDLTSIFGRSPVEELCIDIASEFVSHVDWRAVLGAFPRLRSLRVIIVATDIDDACDILHSGPYPHSIIRALDPNYCCPSHQVRGGGTTFNEQDLLCPELRVLQIEGFVAHNSDGLLDELSDCLWNRLRVSEVCRLDGVVLCPTWVYWTNGMQETRQCFEEVLKPMVGSVVYGVLENS